MKLSFVVLAALWACSLAARGQLLSEVFGDNMVLQAAPNSAVLFGGNAVPHSRIHIYLDGILSAEANADAQGQWIARLAPVEASNNPRVLKVGDQTIEGVLFGDVYVCGGGDGMLDAMYTSIGATRSSTNVRAVRITEDRSSAPLWVPVGFAADDECLNMGLQIAEKTGYPVGLVQAVSNAPLSAWFLPSDKTRIPDGTECSACDYSQSAWDAVMSRVAPMRTRAFVWMGNGANDNNPYCVESKCVHPQLAVGMRSEFTTNNMLLRTLKDDPFIIIGHRGMPSAAPENTIVSQEITRRGGTVWVEDDTQPSSDGVPFVIHDSTVDRTTNGKGAVRRLTSQELKSLDAGSWFHPIYAGTRLPTLDEQLADLKERGGNLLLEIKGAHTFDEVRNIIMLVEKHKMSSRVMIQSFQAAALKYSFQLAPNIPIAYLCSVSGDPVATAKNMNLTGYNPDYKSLVKRPEVVEQLHKIGVTVFVWTVDSTSNWATLKKLGVDGVITNKPTQLQGWVSAIKEQNYGYMPMYNDASQQQVFETPDTADIVESSDMMIVITNSQTSRRVSRNNNFVVVPRGADLASIVR